MPALLLFCSSSTSVTVAVKLRKSLPSAAPVSVAPDVMVYKAPVLDVVVHKVPVPKSSVTTITPGRDAIAEKAVSFRSTSVPTPLARIVTINKLATLFPQIWSSSATVAMSLTKRRLRKRQSQHTGQYGDSKEIYPRFHIILLICPVAPATRLFSACEMFFSEQEGRHPL